MHDLQVKMVVPSTEEAKEVACVAVSSIAEQMLASEEEIEDIRISMVEVLDNCISHAYPDKVGAISIICKVLKNNTLGIIVKDNGVGIKDIEQASQPLFTTAEENHSGLGITIIDSFMTSVKITSELGKGTTVNMKKQIRLE